MNSATGEDLSINASYAAEAVSILFEIYHREIVFPNSCGRWYREGVRAEQLAYKLIVCAESLQTLGLLAEALAFKLSPQATALINCLYVESTSLYPALRSAAGDACASDELCYWKWLKSIEHQDWLRSHLACLEGLARVLHLALASHCPLQNQDNQPFMDPVRQRSLHDAQLSSAIKRFRLACETCHLNLRTLEGSQKEPWKNSPWRLIKPAHVDLTVDAVCLPICTWVIELGRKCDRKDIDPVGRDWDTNRHFLASLLVLEGAFDGDTDISPTQHARRMSSVRWTDDEGGRLQRGCSILDLDQPAGSPRNSNACDIQKPLHSLARENNLSPSESAIIDEEQQKQRSNICVPLSRGAKNDFLHAIPPSMFIDQSSLLKHKLYGNQTLPHSSRSGNWISDSYYNHEINRDVSYPEPHMDTDEPARLSNNNSGIPDVEETPPTRSSAPAIDVPQRSSRRYAYIAPSPQIFSPMISPTDRNAFSPSGSTLSQLAKLSALLETDIKPAVYTFLNRPPALSPISRLDSRDYRSDSQRPGLSGYYALLDRLIDDVIKPANRILPGGGWNSIASREQRRVVREADKWVATLDKWAGEDNRRGSVERESKRERDMERERENQRDLDWEMDWDRKRERDRGRRTTESSRSRDRFYSMSPRVDETGFFGESI